MNLDETQATLPEDWTKKVTLNPPNEVKFTLTDDDKAKLDQAPAGPLDNHGIKSCAKISIINKS